MCNKRASSSTLLYYPFLVLCVDCTGEFGCGIENYTIMGGMEDLTQEICAAKIRTSSGAIWSTLPVES